MDFINTSSLNPELVDIMVKAGVVEDADADEFMAAMRRTGEFDEALETFAMLIQVGRLMGLSDAAILITMREALIARREAAKGKVEEEE